MHHHRWLLALALLLAVPSRASADAGKDADAHVANATKAHAAGRFAEVAAELEAAYALDPRPELLFALGQVHVKLDQCTKAIAYYGRYLATGPALRGRDATLEAIATCQARLTTEPTTPPPEPVVEPSTRPPEPVVEPTTPPPVAATATAHAPWYRDKLGAALVGAGSAVGIVGLVVYGMASSNLTDADAATTYGAHADQR